MIYFKIKEFALTGVGRREEGCCHVLKPEQYMMPVEN